MFFSDMFFVFFFALLITAIFIAGFLRLRKRNALLGYFIIIFLATWAVGAWLLPIGPLFLDVTPWLSFLVAGIVLGLLLMTVAPRAWLSRQGETTDAAAPGALATVFAFDLSFWLLVTVLGTIVLLHYV